jgi:hypothetical protein
MKPCIILYVVFHFLSRCLVTFVAVLKLLTDDTSNFACTGGLLKIKDQAGKTSHEDVRLSK